MVEWKNTVWTYLDCLRGNYIIIFLSLLLCSPTLSDSIIKGMVSVYLMDLSDQSLEVRFQRAQKEDDRAHDLKC